MLSSIPSMPGDGLAQAQLFHVEAAGKMSSTSSKRTEEVGANDDGDEEWMMSIMMRIG